ncbi:hypothetical protein [Aliirhizobium smilacinae]|uniref:Uncharacterized protein n=1 Tax=Aliirhizobium smilacinae TaxID=1395944 RepID=A0A5C4XRF6_9HYPH|nr:hypothetical protein [Rhizobium smilacinae]TNM65551.1 hypothetical protein FHP24_04605 [Rhizobium smilacinae]
MQRELTIEDVLSDPLIAQLRRADGISTPEFTELLLAASQIYGADMRKKTRSAHRDDPASILNRPDGLDIARPQDVAHVRTTPKAGASCIGW